MPKPTAGPDTLHVLGWIMLVVALVVLIDFLLGGWQDFKLGGHDVYRSIESLTATNLGR